MNIDKNTGILYRKWKCPSSKACVLLVHGLGAHSGRWQFMGEFLARNNISSYAIELRGFGETEGPRGHVNSFNPYFDDIRHLYNIIHKENPGRKIFLAGESVGSLISFLTIAPAPHFFDGLICISPAFKSKLRFGLLDYIAMVLALLYNPKKPFKMPFDSGMCTKDAAYKKIMDADKRESRSASARMLFNIAMAQAFGKFSRINIPVLFLVAEDDCMVDAKASKKIFDKLAAEDKTIRQYPGMYHALSIEVGRNAVFKDILEWLNKRI